VKAGGESWIREVNGGNGYSGQSSKRLHFGLGRLDRLDQVEVRWPSGWSRKIEGGKVPLDRITRLREGAPEVAR
jgi:enediyne biosynthesis protein E4